MSSTDPCYCGSGHPLAECCARFLQRGAYPRSAEVLMRSRYSAYVIGNVPYLNKTWHPDTRPELDIEELLQTKWLRLEVIDHKPGLKKAIVEFKAFYRTEDNSEACLHEVSLFKKIKNRWVYVSAENF